MQPVVLTNEEYHSLPFSKYPYPIDLPEDTKTWRCKVGETEFKGEISMEGNVKYWPIEIKGEVSLIVIAKPLKPNTPPRLENTYKKEFKDTRLKRITEHCYKMLCFEVAKYNLECDSGTEINMTNILTLVKNYYYDISK